MSLTSLSAASISHSLQTYLSLLELSAFSFQCPQLQVSQLLIPHERFPNCSIHMSFILFHSPFFSIPFCLPALNIWYAPTSSVSSGIPHASIFLPNFTVLTVLTIFQLSLSAPFCCSSCALRCHTPTHTQTAFEGTSLFGRRWRQKLTFYICRPLNLYSEDRCACCVLWP